MRIFIGAAPLPPTVLPPAPSLPHMQRSALGCGPPILLLGAQACVGWMGGAARPSRIAPTPRWWPPVRLRMSRRLYRQVSGGLASDSCDRPRALRPPNCCPASSCATRTRLHCSDHANVRCAAPPPSERLGVGRCSYLCNGFLACAGSLIPNPAFASHECRQRTRVCHADAPAPLGSRERASRCCPHQRCGPLPPNFCNRQGIRHPLYPTRPLRLTSAAIAPASTF